MELPFTNPLPANLLTQMVTPAVLISAAGTLVFSTTSRLGRIVDRARVLAHELEHLGAEGDLDGGELELRRGEIERQIELRAQRSRLVQSAVTGFYLALGCFVGATVGLGLAAFAPPLAWLPGSLGVVGTAILFGGCVQLIRETRLALAAVDEEMTATRRRLAHRRGG